MFGCEWSAVPAAWGARRWGSDGGIFQEKDMNRAMRLAAALGINGDNSVGHLSTGEVVIPRGMMSPKLMAALQEAADETGTPLESFVVGSPTQQVNPHTGQPMFAGLGRGNGGRGGLGGRNEPEGRGGQRAIGRTGRARGREKGG